MYQVKSSGHGKKGLAVLFFRNRGKRKCRNSICKLLKEELELSMLIRFYLEMGFLFLEKEEIVQKVGLRMEKSNSSVQVMLSFSK